MIRLTQLSGRPVVINVDLIETVECTPDTIISLTTGKKIIVRESDTEVIERTAAFRRACQWSGHGLPQTRAALDETTP